MPGIGKLWQAALPSVQRNSGGCGLALGARKTTERKDGCEYNSWQEPKEFSVGSVLFLKNRWVFTHFHADYAGGGHSKTWSTNKRARLILEKPERFCTPAQIPREMVRVLSRDNTAEHTH